MGRCKGAKHPPGRRGHCGLQRPEMQEDRLGSRFADNHQTLPGRKSGQMGHGVSYPLPLSWLILEAALQQLQQFQCRLRPQRMLWSQSSWKWPWRQQRCWQAKLVAADALEVCVHLLMIVAGSAAMYRTRAILKQQHT
mmetsp:Transcript_29781/g.58494  ORF Transcript_29781/g.58494 Transcript_29781/m.58494 type:complete len:138 (-) Transcript_29781:16-429(-)